MAQVHNSLRRAGAILQGIKSVLGVQEAESGVERFGETLTPVLDVWGRPEFAMPRGELLFARDLTSAAGGAGTRSKAQIWNPSTNRLVMVDALVANITGAAGYVQVWLYNAELTTLVASFSRRDMRWEQPTAVCQQRTSAEAGNLGTHMLRWGVAADTAAYIPVSFVLSPGWGLHVQPSLDNTAITVSFIGRERVALPGEL